MDENLEHEIRELAIRFSKTLRRQDLPHAAVAELYRRFCQDQSQEVSTTLKMVQFGALFGKTFGWTSRYNRFWDLPEEARTRLVEGERFRVSLSTIEELARHPDRARIVNMGGGLKTDKEFAEYIVKVLETLRSESWKKSRLAVQIKTAATENPPSIRTTESFREKKPPEPKEEERESPTSLAYLELTRYTPSTKEGGAPFEQPRTWSGPRHVVKGKGRY